VQRRSPMLSRRIKRIFTGVRRSIESVDTPGRIL
jgi:hypothetical protein